MRWNEVITEGSDYNCPNCDEYLGKASEVIANNNEYCGNCGWSADDDKPKKPAAAPAPAAKPLPRSKQTVVKTSGEFEARVYPGRKSGGLYFLGKAPSNMDISGGCVGEVAKLDDGTFRATRRLMYGRKLDLGAHATMTQAMNALKARFKSELKKYGYKAPKREDVAEAIGDPMIFGRTVPNWDHEDEKLDAAYFTGDPMYAECQVLYRDGEFEVWFHSEDQHFCKTAEEAEAVLKKYGYTTFSHIDEFSPIKATDD